MLQKVRAIFPMEDQIHSQEHTATDEHGWRNVIDILCGVVEKKAPALWWALFLPCFLLVCLLIFSLVYMVSTGVGVLGTEQNVFWGWDIINFVFWIGIGHAGTLISAILLLTRQQWRCSVSRLAEAATIFAVLCAAIYPVFHMGRIWMAWFFIPAPEPNRMWPNFLSPLMWDAFAVGTYFFLSCAFLYASLIPDVALLRDRAGTGLRAKFYGLIALGWRGSLDQWQVYRPALLLLAGLLTPLVISVHSIVSYDFAVTVIPGWHSSLFPPYFVAGAILGGLAMVLLVVIPLRGLFKLKEFISLNHLDSLAKLLLAMSLSIGFFYILEALMTLYSGHPDEESVLADRLTGRLSLFYILMMAGNVVIPQLFWLRRFRRSIPFLLLVALAVTGGMWLERFVIIAGSMEQTFVTATWRDYLPSVIDVCMFAGTFGLFFGGILLFVRFFPPVGITEMCELRMRNVVPALLPDHKKESYEDPGQFLSAWNEAGSRESILPFPLKALETETNGSLSMGAFTGGVTGFLAALVLLVWTQLIDYPMELQGRPADWERFIGFIPVIFETVILGAGIGVLIMLARKASLFQLWHPWFDSNSFNKYRNRIAFYLNTEGRNTREKNDKEL